jgi:hypothetical protein
LYPGRNADAARFGQCLKPCRDIDPVAEDVPVLDDNVTLVDADAKLDAGVWRRDGAALGYPSLHFGRAAQSVDDTRELHQDSIAGRFEDPTSMLNDFGVDQFAPMRLQPRERAFLVGAYEAAIPGHVSSENGGQPAFDAFRGQSGAPNRMGRIGYRL